MRVVTHTPLPVVYGAVGAATTTLAVVFGVLLARQGVWMSAGFAFFFAVFIGFFTVVTARFGWMMATPEGVTRGVGLSRGTRVPWAEIEGLSGVDGKFELHLSGGRRMRWSTGWAGAEVFRVAVAARLGRTAEG